MQEMHGGLWVQRLVHCLADSETGVWTTYCVAHLDQEIAMKAQGVHAPMVTMTLLGV